MENASSSCTTGQCYPEQVMFYLFQLFFQSTRTIGTPSSVRPIMGTKNLDQLYSFIIITGPLPTHKTTYLVANATDALMLLMLVMCECADAADATGSRSGSARTFLKHPAMADNFALMLTF